MKLLLLSVITITLLGCSDKPPHIVKVSVKRCTTDLDRERLSAFIIKCAEAANPLSDEEGEDLVYQCERTGENVICPFVTMCEDDSDVGYNPKPCELFNQK